MTSIAVPSHGLDHNRFYIYARSVNRNGGLAIDRDFFIAINL